MHLSGPESYILESDWLIARAPAVRIFPSGPRVRTATNFQAFASFPAVFFFFTAKNVKCRSWPKKQTIMDSDNDSYHSENEFYYPDEISYFLNVKGTRTRGLKMAAVKIQQKNCLQSTLRKKRINTLFAGREVHIGKNCALGLEYGRPYSRPLAQFFPIRTSRPANNIYIYFRLSGLSIIRTIRASSQGSG